MRFGFAALTNAPTTSHWDWLVALENLGDWLEQSGSAEAALAFYEQERAPPPHPPARSGIGIWRLS